jgi:hypothetical protein
VVAVGDEAAVGEHAVLADLDELDGRDLHPQVQERAAADPDPRGGRRRQPHARLEQHVLAELEPAVREHLEHVPVHGPAAEGTAACELEMDPCPVPRQARTLVPAPLLGPELQIFGLHAPRSMSCRAS